MANDCKTLAQQLRGKSEQHSNFRPNATKVCLGVMHAQTAFSKWLHLGHSESHSTESPHWHAPSCCSSLLGHHGSWVVFCYICGGFSAGELHGIKLTTTLPPLVVATQVVHYECAIGIPKQIHSCSAAIQQPVYRQDGCQVSSVLLQPHCLHNTGAV